jgi:septum formation protein
VTIILGSASPRRSEILKQMGLLHEVFPANVDETHEPGELPRVYLERVVAQKLAALVLRVRTEASGWLGRAMLVADTIVVCEGAILGKPESVDAAAATLGRLQGRTHSVMTGIALLPEGWSDASAFELRVDCTEVTFVALEPAECFAYAETGEGMDKAGAYAIQGGAAKFVSSIVGSYSNVVGLPANLVWEMLGRPDPRV